MLNRQIRETIQHFRENHPADLSALIEQATDWQFDIYIP